jgi:sarcosine oxidase subunit beta
LRQSTYSAWSLLRGAVTGQQQWPPAWRDASPKSAYDIVIVGGGGHGLATAYYLAKNHGITNVAVLEKGWIGGGNTGRNTTVVRSNYLYPQSARLYDFSLKLYESLSRSLNFNIMLSQRGMIVLAHSRHDLESMSRWANAMRMNGVDADLLSREEVSARVPDLDVSGDARYPVLGGFTQARAGTARHDAVAWGYARGASAQGVDIVQNCEVSGFIKEQGQVVGVDTSFGPIRAAHVGIAAAGHSSVLATLAGFQLPVTSYALQAMVTEPVKPILDTVVLSPATGAYVSQSDKGEMVIGSSLDLFPSYAQRGSSPARWRSFPRSADYRSCGSGRESSTSSAIRARSSAPHQSRISTSIADGAPAASKPFQWAAGHSRTFSLRALIMSWRRRFSSIAS